MDTLTSEKRSWNMSRIRGANTKPEIAVRLMLHRMGYRFRISNRTLPGRPDIVLPKYRAVIFVHGCFWHRHQGCKYAYMPKSRLDFWSQKFEENVMRDKNNLSLLKKAGWLPIVVWECEIKLNTDVVLGKVSEILQRRLKKLEAN
jgi:DNA mismatch endonuclease (patch repair protein)